MAKILLINPSYQAAYGNSKASIVNPFFPTLGLATIAAVARKAGHNVEILDLCWRPYDYNLIKEKVIQGKPDIVGITATTAGMNQLRDISCLVKNISEKKRDKIINELNYKGIEARPMFYPASDMKIYKEYINKKQNYSKISYCGISLPSFVGLNNFQINKICNQIKKVIKK